MSSGDVTFTIAMDAVEVEKVLAETAEIFPRYVNSWLVQSGIMAKGEMESRVNEGVGAAYGAGIKNNIDVTYDSAAMTAMVKPNNQVPYADALETGSAPHKVSTAEDGSLAQWCEMKGLNVFAIAAIIAKQGTHPHPFIKPTFDAVAGPIAQLFTDGVGIYLTQMGVA